MGNELFDIVNPTYLRSLHDIFSDKHNCATAILDERAQPLTSESNFCDFCKEIRRSKSGLKICRESDLVCIDKARQEFEETNKAKPVFRMCEYGLIDACAPIVLDTKIMGYLMAGQFRCKDSEPTLYDEQEPRNDQNPVKSAKRLSPKEIFVSLVTNDSPTLQRLIAETGPKKNDVINENVLNNLFSEVPVFDYRRFKSFNDELSELTGLIIAFITKLRSWHKPEQAYEFTKRVIGIATIDDLYELMVTDLPLLIDAVGASIFVVHHDDQEGDRLVLQKTSFPGLKPHERTAYYERGEGLTGWVWANKRCLRIKSLQNQEELNQYADLKWQRKHDDSDDHTSFLALPMIGHTGEVLGVLRLPHKKGNVPFASDDEIFLRFLADHLSKVIEYQAVQQGIRAPQLLNAAADLLSARSPKEILENALNSSTQVFGPQDKMHFINLLLPGGAKWKIEKAAGTLDLAPTWKGRNFSIDEGLSGKVLRMAMKTMSPEGDIRYDLKKASEKREYVDVVSNARSGMAAPIFWGKRVYGVIAIASNKQYEFTREKDLRILESLAVLTGIALHNYGRRRSKIVKSLLLLLRVARFFWPSFTRTKAEPTGGEVAG